MTWKPNEKKGITMTSQSLLDKLKRPIRDLRLSVTDRCNFRCTYCMPKEIFGDDYAFLKKQELLTFEEIERTVRLFAGLGVKKLRLTGGEPLLRSHLSKLVERLVKIEGIEDIGLTTNGLLLSKYAHDLYNAGLRRLNISLDSLDNEVFGQLNGRGIQPSIILRNIENAVNLGFQVKVNMVVQKGVNDHDIIPMASYFKKMGVTLRFIEFMDVGNDNGWSFKEVVAKKELYEKLSKVFDLEDVDEQYFGEVAKRYRYKDSKSEIGFITSVSDSFCSSCTRARVSSNGHLYTCLFASKGYDLKELIRRGVTDEELLDHIRQVWELRADRYSDERTEQTISNRKKIGMFFIGG